jgi:hypothetical protein
LFRRRIKSNDVGTASVEKQFAKISFCSFLRPQLGRAEIFSPPSRDEVDSGTGLVNGNRRKWS